MSVKFVISGSEGEVSRLPDTVRVATPNLGIQGISFFEAGFRSAGWSQKVINGVEIISWKARSGRVYQSDKLGSQPKEMDSSVAICGSGMDLRSEWTGAHAGRILSISPIAAERITGTPIHRIPIAAAITRISEQKKTAHLLAALSHVLQAEPTPASLLVDSLCLAVLRSAIAPSAWGPKSMYQLSVNDAERIREYIREHLPHDIKIATLAELAGLSEGYFIKAFHRTFGLTPYQYIMRERVSFAQELIRTGRHSLSEVAAKAGFSNPGNMSRTFRNLIGQTPTGRRSSAAR